MTWEFFVFFPSPFSHKTETSHAFEWRIKKNKIKIFLCQHHFLTGQIARSNDNPLQIQTSLASVSCLSRRFETVAVGRVGPTVLPRNRSGGWFLTRGACVNYRQGKRQRREERVLGNSNEQSHCHGLQSHCACRREPCRTKTLASHFVRYTLLVLST